jgi:hypothetical protein
MSEDKDPQSYLPLDFDSIHAPDSHISLAQSSKLAKRMRTKITDLIKIMIHKECLDSWQFGRIIESIRLSSVKGFPIQTQQLEQRENQPNIPLIDKHA